MAYVKGNTILAADLNELLSTVRSVYGVGNGNRGYGQTAVSQSDVVANNIITADAWSNLRTIINTCANHQGTATTLLTPSGSFAAGQTVIAHESDAPSNNAYDLNGMVTAIDTNRLTAAVGSMTLTSAAHTVTRATTWGSGGSATINCTVDVSFTSEDQARYFFNSGGEVRIRPTHSNTSGTQNQNWNSILSTKIGTMTLKAGSFSISGTQTASVTNTGFYGLTTTATSLFNGLNIGTGAYTANDFTVTAQVLNRVGTNGGNGNGIRFIISFIDEHTGTSDTVASGTNVIFDHYRATTHLTGIVVPTYATTDGL